MLKIALDGGHGLRTAGKRCLKSLDPKETREWWLNDRVCDYIEAELAKYDGCQLLRVDDFDDGSTDVPLATRTDKANAWGADVYISVHHNAGVNGRAAGGIVVYTHPKASAASDSWRDDLYAALIRHTGLRGDRVSPKLKENYHVLRETEMPAVLLELGFMDSSTDVPIILTDAHAQKCAAAIVEVLAERGDLTKKDQPQTEKWYRVQVGAFRVKANAERLKAELVGKGYTDAFITEKV